MFSLRYSAVAAKLFRSLFYQSSSYIRKAQIISSSARRFDVNLLVFFAFVLPIKRKLKEAPKETKNDGNLLTSQADILFENRQYQQCFELLSAYPDKDDIEVQWRITRALYNISKEMKIDKQLKKRLIYEAYDIIYRSLESGWNNSNVHKWYALLLDEKSSYEGTKERIKQLEIVKKHMDLAVTLNPKDATTLHMLGEWCFQVAELPWHQRKIAEALFAKPPVSSYEDALEYFLLAETVQPRFYSLNLLRLGICYLRLDKVDQARYYLKLAADYPASSNDDHLASKQAVELLNKINKKYNKVEKVEKIPEQLQTKRELFFKSDSVSGSGVGATGPPAGTPPAPPLAPTSLKDALAKRAATLPADQSPEIAHHETNGKLSNSVSLEGSRPPSTAAPPPPSSTPPVGNHNSQPLRSTENIIKKPDHPPVAPKPDIPKIEKPKPRELDGYVGFANLPNQVYRKAVKKGFEFTLMVVGETGLGKSTLINSLFLTDVYDTDKYPGPSLRVKKTVGVETSVVILKENGVNLTLTIVDTPGFGDAVDNSNCWQPIIDFVESKYEEFLNAESRVARQANPSDTRVHCCLYFIAPSGHGLKPLDVEFMQRLGDKVNIIPVIAKADTMTPEECKEFKEKIMKEITLHKIKIYSFPETSEAGEEGDANEVTRALRARVPFAVVGANTVIEHEGKKLRGRRYPWGIAEVENLEHCDFLALRNMLIRTHLQDLKDVTSSVHYENYRCRKLAGLSHDNKPQRANSNNLCPQGLMNSFMTVWNPLAQMEEEKREHDHKMKKMESDMEQVFDMKVREKRAKLKESEAELARRHEATRRALEQQARDLEDRQRALAAEKAAWERETGLSLDELRRRSLEANSKETMDGKEKKDKKKKGLF